MAVEISPQNRGLRTLQSLVDQLLNSGIKPDVSVPIVLGEFLSKSCLSDSTSFGRSTSLCTLMMSAVDSFGL
jgi:hypothetical protein